MKKILCYLIFSSLVGSTFSQRSDTTEGPKIKPILSQQAVIFDRSLIADQLDALEQPVINPGQVVVQQDMIRTRFDRHEARKLIIPEVELDDVKKYWSRKLKKSGEGKLRTDGNRLVIDQVLIEEISADPFDVEVQMESSPEVTNVWMALERDSVALTSQEEPGLFSALEEYMRNEGRDIYKEKIQDEIDREEKILRDLNNDLDQLIKANERMHKKITDNNLKIEDTNRDLETNKTERKSAMERVSDRKDYLLRVSKEEEKDAKKALKTAERESDKLEKERNKMYDNLVDYEREIQENEQLITQNLNDQKEKLLAIRKQELLVEAYKAKMAAVK